MIKPASTRRGFLLAAGAIATACAAHAQQGHAMPKALTVAEKEKLACPFLALKVFVEIDSEETKGAVSMLRIFVPPGEGPPPHVHEREDEIHTVVRGHYRYRHGD